MSHDDPSRTEPMTVARLQRRQAEVQDRHRRAVAKVGDLLETQRRVGSELSTGLAVLAEQRTELDAIERREAAGGLFATLLRPLVGRRNVLARRSIAVGLLERYEQVSVRLREATAFSDDLKLCALELQAEVDALHRDLEYALTQERLSAARVMDLEAGLGALGANPHATPEQRDRTRDRYTFDLRTESVSMSLHAAAAELCRQHLDPARSLRDTVLRLHEEMAQYVLSATHTVNAAGRRIGALGVLADAPAVVGELQQSLDALGVAIEATTQWIDRSQRFISDVLPELSSKLRNEAEATEHALARELTERDREHTRQEAERALRRAAEAEIAMLLCDRPADRPDPADAPTAEIVDDPTPRDR
ncbi:MAG: hypothetical protein ABMA64_08920 [Myxococcota bacterium]